MTEARTYQAGGKTFVLTHGTIAYKAGNEELSLEFPSRWR